MPRSLIVGGTGQTGAYLARSLVSNGHSVTVTSRSWNETSLLSLERLGLLDSVYRVCISLTNLSEVDKALENLQPDQIYYLAGPSSIATSFDAPIATFREVVEPVLYFLEVLKMTRSVAHFFNAASTDCFGFQPGTRLTEESSFLPRSPYAVAKSAVFWNVKNYRHSFNLNASNGILTNHESPLRGPNFVTQKIITGLRDVVAGRKSSVRLGNTSVSRDWIWASDAAEAIVQINSATEPSDYVVASGKSSTLNTFIGLACAELCLDPKEVIAFDTDLRRPAEIESISLDPARIFNTLGWEARFTLTEIVKALVENRTDP